MLKSFAQACVARIADINKYKRKASYRCRLLIRGVGTSNALLHTIGKATPPSVPRTAWPSVMGFLTHEEDRWLGLAGRRFHIERCF
jgi:hypothetical protein